MTPDLPGLVELLDRRPDLAYIAAPGGHLTASVLGNGGPQ